MRFKREHRRFAVIIVLLTLVDIGWIVGSGHRDELADSIVTRTLVIVLCLIIVSLTKKKKP